MPADASIYGLIRPVQPVNQLEQVAQALQIQGLRDQREMAQYGLRKAQRGDEETNALTQAIRGGLDLGTPEGQRQAYGIAPTVAPGLIKANTEARKEQSVIDENKAKTEKLKTERVNLAVQQGRDQLGAVNDPQAAAAWVAAQYANPDLAAVLALSGRTREQAIAAIPQDMKAFAQWKMQSQLGADKLVQYTTPDANTVANNATSAANNAATNATSRANNAATVAATIRGQNLTDQRARDANAQGKTQIVETPQGFVIVDKATGTSRPATGADGKPLQGKSADRSLNETQAKANLFGTRMQEANRILSSLEEKGVTDSGVIKGMAQGTANMVPFMGEKLSDAVGSFMNIVPGALGGPNSDQQSVEQARRDFINAVLRRESGAAIAASEFANAQRQYFPQPGDSAAVIAQKRKNRELAIRGLEVEVPGGFRGTPPGGSVDAAPPKVVDFGSLK